MGLFDKKFCDICGGKIGMLGNRKLEDGNCCKDCAKKLSPWFDERRHSTVAQIKEQLEYREANKQAVAAFRATRTYGESTVLRIDETQRKFMVARTSNYADENPDVVDLSQVANCTLDVNESKRELKQKDREGKEISFNPPRYEYDYDFYIVINVNHPWFDTIRFKLNKNDVLLQDMSVSRGGILRQAFDPHYSPEYQRYESMGNEITDVMLGRMGGQSYGQSMGMGMNTGYMNQQPGMGGMTGGFGMQQPGMGMSGGFGMQQPGMGMNTGYGMQQGQGMQLKMQGLSAFGAGNLDQAAMLFKQAIQMGENAYDDLLNALSEKATSPTSTAADAQELITWATQAKNMGFNAAQADQLIQMGQRIAIAKQPDGGAGFFAANIAANQAAAMAQAQQQGGMPGMNAGFQQAAVGPWVCPACGGQNNGTGRFCEFCGAPRA